VAAAGSTLQAALAGVDLSDAERKAAEAKLQAAGQNKLASLLQVHTPQRGNSARNAAQRFARKLFT
jgi:hypothetical protein